MAMMKPAPAIRATVSVMPFLRPRRSAYAPRTAAPTGRMTNPTANTARVDSSATAPLPFGKNSSAMIFAKIE